LNTDPGQFVKVCGLQVDKTFIRHLFHESKVFKGVWRPKGFDSPHCYL